MDGFDLGHQAIAHFATFPSKLIEPCVLAGCPENGLVLDPFGGSATTARVAIDHGRRAVCLDINYKNEEGSYLEMAKRRVLEPLKPNKEKKRHIEDREVIYQPTLLEALTARICPNNGQSVV